MCLVVYFQQLSEHFLSVCLLDRLCICCVFLILNNYIRWCNVFHSITEEVFLLQALVTLSLLLIAMKATKNLVSVPLVLKNDTKNNQVLKVPTFLGMPVSFMLLFWLINSIQGRTCFVIRRTKLGQLVSSKLMAYDVYYWLNGPYWCGGRPKSP